MSPTTERWSTRECNDMGNAHLTEKWKAVAESVRDFILDLRLSSLAPSNPMDQYNLASVEFHKALNALRDRTTPEAAKRVRNIATRFWEVAEQFHDRSPSEARRIASDLFAAASEAFEKALTSFRGGPTPETALTVCELARWLLEANAPKAAPPIYQRPSPQYQALFSKIVGALEDIQIYAEKQQ
jgi:hypothetical protein